jgi:choline kinase
MYKVLIASAGLGNRLQGITKNINKALVSVNLKPAISHIIEKFPEDIELVIPVGYKKELVIDFCNIAYPSRKFSFVDVDLFEGEGSGLGYSILKCKELLQCPFIFSSNDTIVLEDIPSPDYNWIGYSKNIDPKTYRSIEIENDNVSNLFGKGAGSDAYAYIGLSGIYDYEKFWQEMEDGKESGSIEIGESFGLRALLGSIIKPVEFTWFDTGNLIKLQETREFFLNEDNSNNEHIILEKEEEAIFFVNNKVIKFSVDKDFISNRTSRASLLQPFTPKVYDIKDNFYSYEWVSGSVLSTFVDSSAFMSFLNWIEDLWIDYDMDKNEKEIFNKISYDFYKDKTYQRVSNYFKLAESYDMEESINGKLIPKVYDLLDSLEWHEIMPKKSTRFHGDLHFENIICNKSVNGYEFKLLDWRQDFGGNINFGDIYYDLAKLNHGLIISHRNIHNELYNVKKEVGKIEFDFQINYKNSEYQKIFYRWMRENSFDTQKVDILTSLIFLNIAALHHFPYNHLLFYLGKSSLYDHLKKDSL